MVDRIRMRALEPSRPASSPGLSSSRVAPRRPAGPTRRGSRKGPPYREEVTVADYRVTAPTGDGARLAVSGSLHQYVVPHVSQPMSQFPFACSIESLRSSHAFQAAMPRKMSPRPKRIKVASPRTENTEMKAFRQLVSVTKRPLMSRRNRLVSGPVSQAGQMSPAFRWARGHPMLPRADCLSHESLGKPAIKEVLPRG